MNRKLSRLLALLAGIVLLLWCFWIVADMPAFTAKGAFHRAECRQLLQESTFLDAIFLADIHYSGRDVMNGKLFVHTGVGVTETALHTTELCNKKPLMWYNDEQTVTIPLTGDLTAEWNPWCAEWQDIGVLVYSPLDFHHGFVTVVVGDLGFDQEFSATETGLVNVTFPRLGSNPALDEERQQITWRQYDLRSVGYDKSKKSRDVTLKVRLLDEDGNELANLKRVYSKYE